MPRRGFLFHASGQDRWQKPGTNPKGEFVFFDVVYEDGSQRSNRRVPAELLGGLEKDEPRSASSSSRTVKSRRSRAARRSRSKASPALAPSRKKMMKVR